MQYYIMCGSDIITETFSPEILWFDSLIDAILYVNGCSYCDVYKIYNQNGVLRLTIEV